MRAITSLLIGTVSVLMLFQASAAAQTITCQVSAACSDVPLLGMSAQTNAHAALIGGNSYGSVLCCSSTLSGLSEGQGGSNSQEILRLYAQDNSHVQDPSLAEYSYPVYISIDNPKVTSFSCSYRESGCDPQAESCILSLSSQSNAHMDVCGHYDPEICCSLTYDNTDPTITDDYLHDGEWVSGSYTITLDPQDSGSGIAEVRYCTDQGPQCDPSQGTVLPLPHEIPVSGTRDDVIRYKAWDKAGNPALEGSVSVMLDNNPPTTSCPSCPPPTEVKGTSFNVRLSAADAETQVDTTEYCVYRDTQPQCANFQNYTAGSDIRIGLDCAGSGEVCAYAIRYRSADILGNAEAAKETSGMTIDKNLPWCEFTEAPEEYSGTRTIGLAWDSDDPVTGSAFQQYLITAETSADGGSTWSPADSLTISQEAQKAHTFSLTQDGHYRFSCVATYSRPPAMASSPGTAESTVDTSPPAVQITTPERVKQSNFTISWTASDSGSGIDHFSLSVGGVLVDGSVQGSKRNFAYDGQYGQDYLVEITAFDRAGNPSQVASKTVTPDNQPPSCSLSPLPEYSNSTSFGISWSSPDSDVDYFDICINSDGSECAEPYPGWSMVDYPGSQFTGGNGIAYHFSCRATDLTGNSGEWSGMESTTIDSMPPRIKNSKPQYNSQVVAGDTYESIVINATVDDVTGISNVSLMFGETGVEPGYISGSAGDTQWNLSWEVPYSTYAGYSGFSLVTQDVLGNMEESAFSYSVLECLPGQSRECHPRDRAKDELYSQGACAYTAAKVCSAEGTWGNCTGGTLPSIEDCNSADDDCDGEVDEDLARKECGFANIGICRLGYRDCVNGEWSPCSGEKLPEPGDVCGNGWDDDCDGSVDEGCVCEEGATQPCGESNQGACRTGTQSCSGGRWGNCVGAVMPSSETCDGLDDDCDGTVDEGCPSSGGSGRGAEPGEFPWWMLIAIGGVILGVLAVLMLNARKHKEELNWENLKKRYSPA